MELWIARDKVGFLNIYDKKPTFDGEYWVSNGSWSSIDLEYFPEVTFEKQSTEG